MIDEQFPEFVDTAHHSLRITQRTGFRGVA